jgi:thioredoxin-related protein
MRFIVAITIAAFLVLFARDLTAAELVMFDSPACEWCELWEEEVGVIYHKTDEGAVAALRRVSIHDDIPEDLKGIKKARYTPTFVLLSNGREMGRINGYPGEDNFWFLLGNMIKKMESQTAACPVTPKGEKSSC